MIISLSAVVTHLWQSTTYLHPFTLDCSVAPRRGGPLSGSISCGIRIGGGLGTIVASGASIAQLAKTLTSWVGRIVFDRAGLDGAFDFTLQWSPIRYCQDLTRSPPPRTWCRPSRIGRRFSRPCRSNWDSNWRARSR
jgi:hypothetical protein